MCDYLSMDDAYCMHTYARQEICLVRGEGSVLYDAKEKRYVDFGAGIGTASLGYGDPALTKAIAAQAASLQHSSNLYVNAPQAALAEALITRTGFGDKVFFCNSGAEANEGLIKLARKASADKYGAGRHTIITLNRSFHGRTVTTLSATGQARLHRHFDPFTKGFRYADADADAVRAAFDESVCAILAEPIQGEGGVHIVPDDFLRFLRAFCDEHDLLLLLDEVQTGVGRTGRFYAHEYAGIVPDALSLAKGIAGGMPMGAFIAAASCADVLKKGDHGSTFGGNPVCAAAACVVVDRVLEAGFLEHIRKMGDLICGELSGCGSVCEIRHRGLMIGIVTDKDPKALAARCLERGLLTLTAGENVLRLLPPLILTEAEAREGISILKEVLS